MTIPTDPETARTMGYAFVDVSSRDEARRATAKLPGTRLLGRKITVQLSRKAEAATEVQALVASSEHLGGYRPALFVEEQRPKSESEHARKNTQGVSVESEGSKASEPTVQKAGAGLHGSKSNQKTSDVSESKRAKDDAWRKSFAMREVDLPSQCACINLPPYFTDGRDSVHLTSWRGEKLDFLAHAMQVSRCQGHSKVLTASCQRAIPPLGSEHGNHSTAIPPHIAAFIKPFPPQLAHPD